MEKTIVHVNPNSATPPVPSGRPSDLTPTLGLNVEATEVMNSDPMIIASFDNHGPCDSKAVTTPFVPLEVAPSVLFFFRDMVMGCTSGGQRESFTSDFDVDLSDDDVVISNSGVYPEIQFSDRIHKVANRRRRTGVSLRASIQNGLVHASNNGSRFGILVDVVDQQALANARNGERNGGDTADNVMPRDLRGMEDMESREGSRHDKDLGSEVTAPQTNAHVEGNEGDSEVAVASVAADNVVISSVAAKGKIVAAPSSLPTGKHTTVRVIDESSKRVL
ncbi:hypothetical protein V6N12_058403 [Hibiscus sabdariffa]|uniref:Uncharacterized protein n=1 Tax=Hibiscus sabdariffa TaxID=183260 RepID=A0ABR2ES18_9ROSI